MVMGTVTRLPRVSLIKARSAWRNPMGRDEKRSSRRLEELIDRIQNEVDGERGHAARARLDELRSQLHDRLNEEDVQRIRREARSLGSEAKERFEDALKHERTQDLVVKIDRTLARIGQGLRREVASEDHKNNSGHESSKSDE